MPFQRVHRTLGCQVCDQEFPGHQGRRCNIERRENVRQHRPVHADCSWLTTRECRGPNLPCQVTDALGVVLAFLLAQQAVRLDRQFALVSVWQHVAVQRVEVELTSLVTPYAASIGISILAWRRPREMMGRAESFRDPCDPSPWRAAG